MCVYVCGWLYTLLYQACIPLQTCDPWNLYKPSGAIMWNKPNRSLSNLRTYEVPKYILYPHNRSPTWFAEAGPSC